LLSDLVDLLADHGQFFAFDPFDHGPMFGCPSGRATIGGVAAAGVSGSGRLSAGALRDHLLGFRAVSGRGEIFVAGGKVVKNVTGFDLSKLAVQSWGRLFAITELTFKVLPRPPEQLTLVLPGLDDGHAVRAMSRAMGAQAEVAAAAHFPAAARDGERTTIFRLQGFGPSVSARRALLADQLGEFGTMRACSPEEAAEMWESLRTLAPLKPGQPLWRICVPPRRAGDVVAALGGEDTARLLDWAGGLVWLATDRDADSIRSAAGSNGGHAALVRAGDGLKDRTPIFHPPAPGVAAIEERLRRAFDPAGLFETGRF